MVSLKFLDSPHDARLIRFILAFADACSVYFHIGCVRWYWDFNDYIVSEVGVLEDSSQFDRVFNSVFIFKFLNYRSDFERQVDVCGNSIGHHLESAIWGYEGNGPISVKPAQPHALMELDIIDLNAFLLYLAIVLVVVSH